MMGRALILSLVLTLPASALATDPADMIVEFEGFVFVERGGETLEVEEVPFILETGDVVAVSPGGRAVLPGLVGSDGIEITASNSPRTIAEARPLLAAMLTATDAERATVGGTDFSTMRSDFPPPPWLEEPRNTALWEAPAVLAIRLPRETEMEFTDGVDWSSEEAQDVEVQATVTMTVFGEDTPLLSTQVGWTWNELTRSMLSSVWENEFLRTEVPLGVALPPGEQIVVRVVSPDLQRLALQIDPSSVPPEDWAWFRVLDESERERAEEALASVDAIAAQLPSASPVEVALWRARALISESLLAPAADDLRAQIAALRDSLSEVELEPLISLERTLRAQMRESWSPSDL